MRWDKFTIKAQEAISEAQKQAEERGHQQIENEQLLDALLQEKEGTVVQLLEKLGANVGGIRRELEQEMAKTPRVEGAAGQVYIGPTLKRSIDIAFSEAERLKDEFVSVEHLFIGIADVNEGTALRIKKKKNIKKERI